MVNAKSQGLRPFADAQLVRQELMRRLPRVAKARGCGMPVLTALDDAYRVVEGLAEVSPQDAATMAKSLLGVLQRLAWVQVCGRVDASPEPATIPLKLWNRGAVSQAARQQLDLANSLSASVVSVSVLMRTCKLLLAWIADDNAPPIFADGEDVLTVKVHTVPAEQSSLIARLRQHAADAGLEPRADSAIAQLVEVTA